MRKRLIVVSTAVLIILLLVVISFFLVGYTHPPPIPFNHLSMIDSTFFPSNILNISRGSTFQVSITQTSFLDVELSLPFESLEITAYNNSSSNIPKGDLFSYSFSTNPLIISPNGANSTVLTVTMTSEAPVGSYLFFIEYGNSNITNVGGSNLIVNIEDELYPTTTPNPRLTVTYSEVSRNETTLVLQFRLEPNSYVFQLDAASFYLVEDGVRISANNNDALVVGTQLSTIYFPINNYTGTNYYLTSDTLPTDTIWVKQ